MMIVKVQISDRTNAGRPQMIVYDEGKRNIWEYEPTDAELKELGFKGGMTKEFWYMKPPKKHGKHKGKLQLMSKIPEFSWPDW